MSDTRGAGIIIYRLNKSNDIEYLFLQSSKNSKNWTPPKGRLNFPQEELINAALRETNEEAGLIENTHYEFLDKSYFIDQSYIVRRYRKTVRYWIAKINDNDTKITLSDEHQSYKWITLQDASSMINKNILPMLEQAEEYIKSFY